MLPVITEEITQNVIEQIFDNMPEWRKKMIHYIKDENPEINAAIIEAAKKSDLDPKAIALGAYMSYIMVEAADKESDDILNYSE